MFNNILSYIVVITFIGGGNRSTWRNILTCETGVHGETYRHVKLEYMEKHTDMWNRSTWRNIPTCGNRSTWRNIPTCGNQSTWRNIPTCGNRSTWRNIPTCGNRSTWRNIPTCGKSLITSSLKVITSTPSHRLEPNSHVYMGSYILFLYVKSSFSCIFQSVH